MKKSALSIILFSLLSGCPALASTIVLEGAIDNTAALSQERVFNLPQGGLGRLVFRFARPGSFKGAFLSQRIADDRLSFDPKPERVTAETDPFGNAFTVAEWTYLKKDPVVRESFNVKLNIELKEIKSSAPYPLPRKGMTGEELRFLRKTP
ncbi:MAG: hypothetical protein HZB21_04340, partial [Deltaproteobacteria bacterium]|nr:hypothetical protein [Deltaproteobacteria bacterium]